MENNNQQPAQPKAILVPRCVDISEMFNLINDKLDYLISLKEIKESKKE